MEFKEKYFKYKLKYLNEKNFQQNLTIVDNKNQILKSVNNNKKTITENSFNITGGGNIQDIKLKIQQIIDENESFKTFIGKIPLEYKKLRDFIKADTQPELDLKLEPNANKNYLYEILYIVGKVCLIGEQLSDIDSFKIICDIANLYINDTNVFSKDEIIAHFNKLSLSKVKLSLDKLVDCDDKIKKIILEHSLEGELYVRLSSMSSEIFEMVESLFEKSSSLIQDIILLKGGVQYNIPP